MSFRNAFVAVLVLACMAVAQPCLAHGLRLAQISSIKKVIRDGRKDEFEARECASFTMTKQEVAEYFRRAKLVPETMVHELDWSACHVTGLAMVQGKKIKWEINLSGAATVEWLGLSTFEYYTE